MVGQNTVGNCLRPRGVAGLGQPFPASSESGRWRTGCGLWGGTVGDVLQPAEGEIADALAHTPRETKGDVCCDAVGELGVLADGVEEGVESGVGDGSDCVGYGGWADGRYGRVVLGCGS